MFCPGIPSVPRSLVLVGDALEVGHRPVRALIKAGESLVDKVYDFDGDQSTIADARRQLDKLDVMRYRSPKDRWATIALATVLAPIGATLAPITHLKTD